MKTDPAQTIFCGYFCVHGGLPNARIQSSQPLRAGKPGLRGLPGTCGMASNEVVDDGSASNDFLWGLWFFAKPWPQARKKELLWGDSFLKGR